LRIRIAWKSGTAPRSARVHKHQVSTCGRGGHIYRANLRGHGPPVSVAYSRSHFANTQCEADRGRIPLCLCLQARNERMRSWRTYPPCESRRPRVVNIAYRRSLFANAQYEAVRHRIPLCLCLLARSGRMRPWWTYPPCESRSPRGSISPI